MSEKDRLISSTILSKAFKKLYENPLTNIGCTVGLINEDDYYNWKCTLKAPKDSPYQGGYFQIFIKFPITYPIDGPEVIFNTPIFHLNINPVKTKNEKLGHVCIQSVNSWNPDYSIEDLLFSIYGLFYVTNRESAFLGYGEEALNEFTNDKNAYNKRVKYFTQKYANGKTINSGTERWDFNYVKDN